MRMSIGEEFLAQYNRVFDTDGKVKLCSREECKKLIELANKINPEVNYGRIRFGMMEIENMHKLHEELLKTA